MRFLAVAHLYQDRMRLTRYSSPRRRSRALRIHPEVFCASKYTSPAYVMPRGCQVEIGSVQAASIRLACCELAHQYYRRTAFHPRLLCSSLFFHPRQPLLQRLDKTLRQACNQMTHIKKMEAQIELKYCALLWQSYEDHL